MRKSEQGRFVGRISDASDSVIAGAVVRATNAGTNIIQTATTNRSGEFVITPVQAGSYTITVTAPGFESINTSNVEVQVGQIVREDLHLKIGSSTTVVEVTTATPLLTTDSATGRTGHHQQATHGSAAQRSRLLPPR